MPQSKFGQGYQVELKAKTVDREDEDYKYIVAQLYRTVRQQVDDEAANVRSDDDVLFLAQTALQSLTGDDYLSSMLMADEIRILLSKNSDSPLGFSLDELASFATMELRIRNLNSYVSETYPNSMVRERQDNKVRYEVGNSHRIATIFASIEESKKRLMIADYGVSQTSLEQVFNMKTAESEQHSSTCDTAFHRHDIS
jgi:hypothetical protein